jgi:putative ABC transport system permease protein
MLSLSERTREIGLLRADGMKLRRVRVRTRSESVILALSGAIVVAAAGTGLGTALAASLDTRASSPSCSR